MRNSKRVLAGVAAGALAATGLTFVAVAAAPAANAVTSTTTGVRVTYTGTPAIETQDPVPFAAISWSTSTALVSTDTIAVTLTAAPNGSAKLGFGTQAAATPTTALQAIDASGDGFDTGNLISAPIALTPGTPTAQTIGSPAWTQSASGGVYLGVAANTPGLYAGTISVYSGVAPGAFKMSVPFSFTTTGKPVAMSLTPATATVPVAPVLGQNAELTLALVDAGGNLTQPSMTDSVAVAVSPAGNTLLTGNVMDYSNLNLGYWDMIDFGASVSGSYALTATPAGTIAALPRQTSIINVSGTIDTTPITSATVTAPADGITDGTGLYTPDGYFNYVPSGTSEIKVLVGTGSSADAGKTLRFMGFNTDYATGTESADQFQNVTLGASGYGTATFAASGIYVQADDFLTIEQVDGANDPGVLPTIEVVQLARAVTVDTVYATPDGDIVAKVGTETPVAVDVLDQFGTPQAGWTVRAYRTSATAANLLSTGTTNADGTANVTVKPAASATAGTSETYVFVASSSTGVVLQSAYTLTVLYTADGTVTNLSANIGVAGATNPINQLTTAQPVLPLALVPTDGTAAGATASTYTPASDSVGNPLGIGDMIPITFTTSPANAITVTAPEGVKMTTASSRSWAGGSSSALVSSGTTLNFFSTKTGVKEIKAESGGKTITIKVVFTNLTTDWYNIAVSPATQEITTDGFGRVTVTVTDVFGNPVNTTSGFGIGGYAPLNVKATGDVLLGGLTNTATVGTGADGKAEIVVIGAADAGVGKVTVTGSTGAWAADYTPPTGAPAPVKSGSADITVIKGGKALSITSSGRTTVSGKPGVYANGSAIGFVTGDTVKVFVKFPGQTEYTQGSATPKIAAGGTFEWSRKTGKKTYVYFTSNDGKVKSNSVVIPAN